MMVWIRESVDKRWEKSITVGYMEFNIIFCAIIWHLIIDSSDRDRKCPISSTKIKLCVFYMWISTATHTRVQKLSSVVKNLIISSHFLSIFLVLFGKKSYKNSVTSQQETPVKKMLTRNDIIQCTLQN